MTISINFSKVLAAFAVTLVCIVPLTFANADFVPTDGGITSDFVTFDTPMDTGLNSAFVTSDSPIAYDYGTGGGMGYSSPASYFGGSGSFGGGGYMTPSSFSGSGSFGGSSAVYAPSTTNIPTTVTNTDNGNTTACTTPNRCSTYDNGNTSTYAPVSVPTTVTDNGNTTNSGNTSTYAPLTYTSTASSCTDPNSCSTYDNGNTSTTDSYNTSTYAPTTNTTSTYAPYTYTSSTYAPVSICDAGNSCNSSVDNHSVFNAPTTVTITGSATPAQSQTQTQYVYQPVPQPYAYAQPNYQTYQPNYSVYPSVYNQPYPVTYPQPVVRAPYVSLSAVPYTGLDLGPVGTALYWSFLILWCLVAAYLIVVKRVQNTLVSKLNHFLFGSTALTAGGLAVSTVSGPTLTTAPAASAPLIEDEIPHAAPARKITDDGIDPFVASQIAR